MSISSGGDANSPLTPRPRRAAAFVLCVALACLATACGRRSAGEAEIAIDPSERFQTISGWEATAEIEGALRGGDARAIKAEMLDRTVEDIGVNRIRLEVRSGVESRSDGWRRFNRGEVTNAQWRPMRYATQNDNDDPFLIEPSGFNFSELDWRVENVVLPLAARLKARGERLYVNLCYVSFMGQGENLPYDHQDPEEYAEFMLATFEHLKQKYGLSPDGLEVILEPDLTPFWSVDGGAKIAAAIAATAKRLNAAGFDPEFIAPSVTNMTNAIPYLTDILDHPVAREKISEFSYHRYQGASRERTEAIAALAVRHGKRAAMLEYWLGNGVPELLFEDLKYGRNSAWQGRALVGQFDIVPTPNGHDVRLKSEVRYNRIFYRAARAGSVRIGASTSNPAFEPLAFENADGGVAVIIKADAAGNAAVRVPPGAYRVEMALDGIYLSSDVVAHEDGVRISFPSKGYGSVRPSVEGAAQKR